MSWMFVETNHFNGKCFILNFAESIKCNYLQCLLFYSYTFSELTNTLEAKMDSLIASNMVPQYSGFIKGKLKLSCKTESKYKFHPTAKYLTPFIILKVQLFYDINQNIFWVNIFQGLILHKKTSTFLDAWLYFGRHVDNKFNVQVPSFLAIPRNNAHTEKI